MIYLATTAHALTALPTIAALPTLVSLLCFLPTLIFALFMLYGGYERLRKKRLLENVPTSKIAGLTLGLNEVKGRAYGDPPLTAPISGEKAVFYMYCIYESSPGDASSSKPYGDWSIDPDSSSMESIFSMSHVKMQDDDTSQPIGPPIDTGKNHCDFYLEDDTGTIRVRPTKKALFGSDSGRFNVDLLHFMADPVVDHICKSDDPMYYEKGPPESSSTGAHRRQFKEWIIPHDSEVYVIGPVRLRDDIVEPEMAVQADMAESDHIFFLSMSRETELIDDYFRQSRKNYGCSLGLIVIASWIYATVAFVGEWADIVAPNIVVATILAIAGWALAVMLLYLKTIYDGLVDLRHRKERAWAMLDVEYKRRNSLIPRLVTIVESMAAHEKQLQQAATQARNTASTDGFGDEETARASQVIDQQSQALSGLFAVVEDNPQIQSHSHFETLMEELTRCEDKIAMARRFYNSSVERLNNRVQTFPDMLIAPVARAKTQDFLEFQDFEKKPIAVELQSDTPNGDLETAH